MYSYFHKTKIDEAYYEAYLQNRLPDKILDAHAHFNLKEHVANISQETVRGDWALECGLLMSYEDASIYTSIMFPKKNWSFVALPWPLFDADTVGNNEYIASLISTQALFGLYTVRPEYPVQMIEQAYLKGKFNGFKPYPYMASVTKGAEVSIFDFMPCQQFELANLLHAPILLHLPRSGRLPDADNIREIRIILNNYPNIKLVIAHFGRCFNHEYFLRALDILGEDVHRVWFDTAAVLNPKVYEIAFSRLDYHRIIFGTDLPIFLWHGKREWDTQGYHNLCRENFSWNTHKYPEEEGNYTFYIYEQLNNLLNVINSDQTIMNAVFYDNAVEVYGHKKRRIKKTTFRPERHLGLLLTADPDESVVQSYIHDCTLYECTENGIIVGIAIILKTDDDSAEIKNIAVSESAQRAGIGTELIKYIHKDVFPRKLIVGTADVSSEALAFYIKNNFRIYGRIPRFFIDQYKEPVFDKGRLCRDMILLERGNHD